MLHPSHKKYVCPFFNISLVRNIILLYNWNYNFIYDKFYIMRMHVEVKSLRSPWWVHATDHSSLTGQQHKNANACLSICWRRTSARMLKCVTLFAYALWPLWRLQLSDERPRVATQAGAAKHHHSTLNFTFSHMPLQTTFPFFPCCCIPPTCFVPPSHLDFLLQFYNYII